MKTDENMKNLSGKCLCGAVEFTVERRDLKPPTACHCSQCRRWSGNYWASVNAPLDALSIVKGEDKIIWRRATPEARRGACGVCGSPLFWHGDGWEDSKDRVAISLGALDAPTGLKLAKHIFVADKGDYYEIADGLEQLDRE